MDLDMDLDMDDSRRRYSTRPQVDLSEWVGHRVLAFKESVYHVGVIIHVTQDTCDVTVSFEGDPQPILYPDVLSVNALTSLPPIIGDQTPASDQVTVGSWMLLDTRTGSGGHTFVPGWVEKVASTPQGQPLFLVKLQSGTQMWTRRSQLRATAAP